MTLRLHGASFAARAVTIVTSAFRLYDRNSRSEKYRVFAWTTSRCIPATTSSSSTAGTPSSECSTSGCELLIFSEQHWTLRLFLLFHLGWRGARAVAVATASRLEICWFMLVVNVSLNAEYHLCSGVGRFFPGGGDNSEFFRGGSKGYSSIGAQQWRDFIFLTRTEHKKKFYYKFNRNISHFKPGGWGGLASFPTPMSVLFACHCRPGSRINDISPGHRAMPRVLKSSRYFSFLLNVLAQQQGPRNPASFKIVCCIWWLLPASKRT